MGIVVEKRVAFVALCALYALLGLCIPSARADEGTFTTLHIFNPGHGGLHPRAGLTLHSNGSFYGTTYNSTEGPGTIYRFSETGGLESLHTLNGAEGLFPSATMIVGSDGNLYGTTSSAGSSSGGGTVFRMTPDGSLTVLHVFESLEGSYSNAGPTEFNGVFYGTTSYGGANDLGTIYSLTKEGTFTLLHTFSGADGGHPMSELLAGPDGNFYGTTFDHGAHGYGTVFRITPHGDFSVLHTFDGSDGAMPWGGLTLGPGGDLYGTTTDFNVANGTIFKISLAGEFTALYSFEKAVGKDPRATLIVGSDGNFYGMTEAGGLYDFGTIFRFTPDGKLTTLHTFSGPDGAQMQNALVEGAPGVLYGTAYTGGDSAGTIFKLELNVVPAPPEITISANPTTLQAGNQLYVSWSVLHALECEASGAWSGPRGPSGLEWFRPMTVGFVHYVLTCTGPGGTSHAEALVTTTQPPPTPVVTLTLSQASIRLGQSSTLSWTSKGADDCMADGSWFGNVPTAGSATYSPSSTGDYTYKLTCSNTGGSSTAEITLTVLPPAPVVTVSLSATQITLGQSVDLSWTSANATSCSADGSWSGTLETNGSRTQKPSEVGQHNYVVRCTGEGGTSEAQRSLTVVAPAPTLSFTSDHAMIQQGDSATLSWEAQNANACTASGAWSGALPVKGSVSVTPTDAGQYQYKLSCTGNGSVSASVSLTVQPKVVSGGEESGGGVFDLWSLMLLGFVSMRSYFFGVRRHA